MNAPVEEAEELFKAMKPADEEPLLTPPELDPPLSHLFKLAALALGLEPDGLGEWIDLRVQGITPRYVRELRYLGVNELEVDELVELSIHHVTPRFIREMRDKFGEHLRLDQLLEIRLHGIDEGLLEELRASGMKIKTE